MRPIHTRQRERPLIELFLSEYDTRKYRNCRLDWLEDTQDGAVEVLATDANGRTLAIEHTLIQPFVGEKRDADRFVKAFLRIEHNMALVVPERDIEIAIPVGSLATGYNWEAIGEDVTTWLLEHRQSFPEGLSRHVCMVGKSSRTEAFALNIQASVMNLPGTPGSCRISRCDVPEDLGHEVVRALRAKLPKLVNTQADTRILLLERDQIFPSFLNIYREIERVEDAFPMLSNVDEIWFANTAAWETEQYVAFWLCDQRGVAVILNFRNGMLTSVRDDRLAQI